MNCLSTKILKNQNQNQYIPNVGDDVTIKDTLKMWELSESLEKINDAKSATKWKNWFLTRYYCLLEKLIALEIVPNWIETNSNEIGEHLNNVISFFNRGFFFQFCRLFPWLILQIIKFLFIFLIFKVISNQHSEHIFFVEFL